MTALAILIGMTWLIAGGLLLLHYHSKWLGYAPLLIIVGALAAFTQSQFGIYIEPRPHLVFFLSANILIPNILMVVLILYICNGTLPARMTIGSILGVALLSILVLQLYRSVLTLPDTHSYSDLPPDQVIRPIALRTSAAAIIAFAVDMLAIAIGYQVIRNYWRAAPEWFAVGVALTLALWADSLVFSVISDWGKAEFTTYLTSDLVAKTISAAMLAPLVGWYMVRWAPTLTTYLGAEKRPTFDLIFGEVEALSSSLQFTRSALAYAESQRQRESTYFQKIADHVSEALWMAEPNTLYPFYINSAYGEIWGRSVESIYADHNAFVGAIHPEDRERILAALPQQSIGGYEAEYRIIRPDGHIRWVWDRAFPIVDENGQLYRIAGICLDITERKSAEKQGIELTTEREKVKLLRDFISDASHDLRSPITAMNLKIHQMLKQPDPDKYNTYLRDLQYYADRMARMIDDLLVLARMENPALLTQEAMDWSQLVQEICTGLQPMAQQKGLTIHTATIPAPVAMVVDRSDLTRALTNLLENAIRYTPEQGSIHIRVEMTDHEVTFVLQDNGVGIPAEDLPHIFERFYRSPNARQLDQTGTGLGLAIVKKVAERHHGRIEVESTEGQGTTFRLRLPKVG